MQIRLVRTSWKNAKGKIHFAKVISRWTTTFSFVKNQELKSALIAETPWVLEAESETEQMRRVALLMDFNLMNQQVKSTIDKLGQRQNSDGSFSWFPGSWPDRTITQHIVSQIAHLQKLGVIEKGKAICKVSS